MPARTPPDTNRFETDRFDTSRFDDAYYRRFYGDASVHTSEQVQLLASAVHQMCAWWGLTVTSVLDVGAGPGFWRDWYRETHPDVRVLSTDVSRHACETYGHTLADICTWAPKKRFDLVVCHSVLQYPDDDAAASAIANLGTATKHFMYLEAPTKRDYAETVDPRSTDMDVHRRSATWYRRELTKHFRQVGAGLWQSRTSNIPMYELEMAQRT